jgi:precorrin-6A synthase
MSAVLPCPVTLTLVGIGTGNPDHMTLQGISALNSSDLILVPRKAGARDELAGVRRKILALVLTRAVRVAEVDLPERETGHADYAGGVSLWHDQIAEAWRAAIAAALLVRDRPGAGQGDCGPERAEPLRVAVMIWGDPSLFDSALRVAARLRPLPDIRVVPGISALHALTAAHAIPLNDTGRPVVLTTGRRLREAGWPGEADTVAVFVDAGGAFQALDPAGVTIWWGAYLGMPEELLDHGPLAEAAPRILAVRAAARARHGWIMDLYLLRR